MVTVDTLLNRAERTGQQPTQVHRILVGPGLDAQPNGLQDGVAGIADADEKRLLDDLPSWASSDWHCSDLARVELRMGNSRGCPKSEKKSVRRRPQVTEAGCPAPTPQRGWVYK